MCVCVRVDVGVLVCMRVCGCVCGWLFVSCSFIHLHATQITSGPFKGEGRGRGPGGE